MNQETNSTLLGRMLEEGRISPALASAALERNSNLGERFEEALLECGLTESALLRHLAEMFGTKFISTKTLRTIVAPPHALNRLPQRLAEDYQAIPIRFGADETVTVITSDAGNPELLERVRVAAGARKVAALIARPAAVRAVIAKLYGGEENAFDALGQDEGPQSSQPPPGNFNTAPNSGSNAAPDSTLIPPPSPTGISEPYAHSEDTSSTMVSAPDFLPIDASTGDTSSTFVSVVNVPAASEPSPTQLGADEPAPRFVRPKRPSLPPLPPPPPSIVPSHASSSPPAPSLAYGAPPALDQESLTQQARARALGNPTGLTEALIVISERSRGSLKGHSVRVARLAHALCRELDLSEDQSAAAWAAGLLHDMGKTQPHHLTPLNVWQLRDHENAARSQYGNPSRMLKNAAILPAVAAAILHMYERYDGRGFPEGLEGERIPYLSRVLALCDTVMDLTLNPNNVLGRIISPIEAGNHIKAQTPRVFDPTLVAHFSRLLVENRLDEVFQNDRSVQGIEKLLA